MIWQVYVCYLFIGIVLGMFYGMVENHRFGVEKSDAPKDYIGFVVVSMLAWLPILCAAFLFGVFKKVEASLELKKEVNDE